MSMLFFYKILFMIELLISEYLFAFRMKKKKHFILRVIGAWIFSLAISALYPLPLKYAYTSWYSTIMFIILFVVAFFHLKFVFNISWSYAFFCAIASYTIRHFAYGIYVLIFSTFGWINSNDPYSSNPLDFANFDQRTIIIILSYLDIFLFCYWGGYILFASKLKHALRFLDEGNKVKITMRFKGRQLSHMEVGQEVIDRFISLCGDKAIVEKPAVLDKRTLIVILASKVKK